MKAKFAFSLQFDRPRKSFNKKIKIIIKEIKIKLLLSNPENVDLYLSDSGFTLNVLKVPLTVLGLNLVSKKSTLN